jgi:hypothetical protein
VSCQYLPCCVVNKDKSVCESSTRFDLWVSDSRWGTQRRCRTRNPSDCIKRRWTVVLCRWVSCASWRIEPNGCSFEASNIASSQSSGSMLSSDKVVSGLEVANFASRRWRVTDGWLITDSWLFLHQAWLQDHHGLRLPTIPSLSGEIQDNWSLVHFPSGLKFLSLTSSSIERLIFGLTDTNMRIFCHFTRFCPT